MSRPERLLVSVLAAVLAALALASPAHAASAQGAAVQADTAPAPGWQRQLLVEVNSLRAAAGLAPVRLCASLGRAARAHARDLAAGTPFGHVGSDGSGPAERVRAQGYLWRAVGENVAAGQPSVRAAMESWVGSDGHLANLLNPAFRHMGVAVVVDATSTYGTYWVQAFGRGGSCTSRPGQP